MTKHTPGPWHLINDHCVGGPESTNGAGQGVAMCGMRARGHEEAKANASLIAAAPEMLEALDIVVGCLLWNKQDEASIEVMRRVNVVRAKAEGRS